jgi:hypothetical protein
VEIGPEVQLVVFRSKYDTSDAGDYGMKAQAMRGVRGAAAAAR